MLIKSNWILRNRRKVLVLLSVVLFMGVGVILGLSRKTSFAADKNVIVQENYVTAEKGNVKVSITSSGAIESSNTKNIASEVSAKVKKVNVSVGDKVSKGDILFELDSTELDTQIRNKQKSVTSYQKQITNSQRNVTNYEKNITNYEKTIDDYNDDINNLNVYSTLNGYVQNLKIVTGDNVNKNAVVFEVVEDDCYVLKADFPYFENDYINIGDSASMIHLDSFGTIEGIVTKVSDLKKQGQYGQVQEVTISMTNPGYTLEGLSVGQVHITTQKGTNLYSEGEGVIKASESQNFRVSSSGTVKEIYISNGSYINNGDLVMVLDNSDLIDKISNANDSIDNARASILDAQATIKENQQSISDVYEDISDLKDNYSFYTITAPIDGIVTSVNVSEGDYVRAESTIAKLVNTDVLQFEISVDELDILKLELGQEAKITIDAIEETKINPIVGRVTEIGLEGTNMNSVTSYPVIIQFEGREDIKMGMNCSVEIVVESAEDVLTVPVEAVNSRRNKYFITLENGEIKEVEIGIYDEENIEIKSGLSVGDKVKLPDKVLSTDSSDKNNEKADGGFNMFGGGSMQSMPQNGSFNRERPAGMPSRGGF